jgi:hypothetical protein
MNFGDDSDEEIDLDQHQRKFFDIGPFDPKRVDLNKPAMTAEEYLKQVCFILNFIKFQTDA